MGRLRKPGKMGCADVAGRLINRCICGTRERRCSVVRYLPTGFHGRLRNDGLLPCKSRPEVKPRENAPTRGRLSLGHTREIPVATASPAPDCEPVKSSSTRVGRHAGKSGRGSGSRLCGACRQWEAPVTTRGVGVVARCAPASASWVENVRSVVRRPVSRRSRLQARPAPCQPG